MGGPYLCVHWRRKDFVKSYSKQIPSINGTAMEIVRLLTMLNLSTVFLATDAPDHGTVCITQINRMSLSFGLGHTFYFFHAAVL